MNKSNPFSQRRRRAVTLIEVVVGLVLLAVLVSSITMARSRFLHQSAEARAKSAAVEAADRLIASWLAQETDRIPLRGQGTLDENLAWRTLPVNEPGAQQLGCVVVRLELYRGSRRVLAIDLLKHVPAGRAREAT